MNITMEQMEQCILDGTGISVSLFGKSYRLEEVIRLDQDDIFKGNLRLMHTPSSSVVNKATISFKSGEKTGYADLEIQC